MKTASGGHTVARLNSFKLYMHCCTLRCFTAHLTTLSEHIHDYGARLFLSILFQNLLHFSILPEEIAFVRLSYLQIVIYHD